MRKPVEMLVLYLRSLTSWMESKVYTQVHDRVCRCRCITDSDVFRQEPDVRHPSYTPVCIHFIFIIGNVSPYQVRRTASNSQVRLSSLALTESYQQTVQLGNLGLG